MIKLPTHINLSLEHNPHSASYMSVEEWEKCVEISWISEEERSLAIKHDSMWSIVWYPDNPVGSYSESAHDLKELLDYVDRHY